MCVDGMVGMRVCVCVCVCGGGGGGGGGGGRRSSRGCTSGFFPAVQQSSCSASQSERSSRTHLSSSVHSPADNTITI